MTNLSNKKKIVFLTGAGISQESGISTFRDLEDGLWNNFKIEDVATLKAWNINRDKCLEFYNARREDMLSKEPNDAHKIVAEICNNDKYDSIVYTQNIDNLHEKGGLDESKVKHLHGNLMYNKSTFPGHSHIKVNSNGLPLTDDQRCPKGSRMRHDVVVFDEELGPEYSQAIKDISECDILVIVGTSLQVEPVASLPYMVKESTSIYYIDPVCVKLENENVITYIEETATVGMKKLQEILN